MLQKIRQSITAKRSVLIRAATAAGREGDLERKADAEMRLRCLLKLHSTLQAEIAPTERPKLFVSFSVRDASGYYERAARRAAEIGFDVHDGFKRRADANVLTAVRHAIGESAVFLAIMTPELRIKPRRGKSEPDPEYFAPSVWVVEEKGMALGLGKPFRLLVHRSVHPDFWLRTTPGNLHHVFDERSFDAELDDALGALKGRHEELQLASVGVSFPEQERLGGD